MNLNDTSRAFAIGMQLGAATGPESAISILSKIKRAGELPERDHMRLIARLLTVIVEDEAYTNSEYRAACEVSFNMSADPSYVPPYDSEAVVERILQETALEVTRRHGQAVGWNALIRASHASPGFSVQKYLAA